MVEYLGRVYNYEDKERLIRELEAKGYRCKDVGGSSPDLKETISIEGGGKWFTYIRCRGPECSVYEYLCLKEGEIANVRRTGYEYRQDSAGGYYSWDETLEYVNTNGVISNKRIIGGYDYHPNINRIEKRTKFSDVRDLYPS